MHLFLRNKFNIFNALLIFLFVFISALPFAFIGADALHDGLMYKVAIDVWSGKMLFSETYSYYGIISPIVHSWFLQFLGNYLYSIRVTTVIVYSLTSVLLFFLWNKFAPKWISLIAIIFWVMVAPYYYQIFYPWPSVFAMFFQVLTIFLYIQVLDKDNKYLYILIGVSACLTFFSKQSYALLFLFLVFFELLSMFLRINKLSRSVRNASLIGIGFFITFLLVIFWIFMNHALHDYWLQVIRQGYSVGKIVGGSFIHNFLSYYSRHPFWLLIFLSSILLFFDSLKNVLQKQNNKINLGIMSVSFLSFSSFAQIYPTVDPSHTYWAIAPGFVFGFLLIHKYKKYIDKNFRTEKCVKIISYMFIGAIIVLLLAEPIYTLNRAKNVLSLDYLTLKSPAVLEKMRINNKNAIFYKEINDEMNNYFKEYPNKKFVIDNSDAIYSTFTDRSVNVLPIFANFSGYSSGYYNFDKAINDYVVKNKPLVLVESVNISRFENYHLVRVWRDQKLALVASDEE